ncbi:MAG TPA: AraC family transcriptional regulator [Chitinophagaceae bacterium]|nr:AraC family transcriptional regulator [Chitinophagaceae bacterium]
MNKLSALKTSTRSEIVNRINSGKEFIDMSFLQNPDVMSIARQSNMSVFHFHRCFKQVHGISPYQYMLGKRLEYARELLNERTWLISDIAGKCGFPDVFTFSKAYKRKYGCSPSKSRAA